MNGKSLLDTSFLVALVNENDLFHAQALDFYAYFVEHKIPMLLSTIVLAEFCVRQDLSDLNLSDFRVLPFNLPDARTGGQLDFQFFKNRGIQRECLKDDLKIIAQGINENVKFFATADEALVNKLLLPYQSKLQYKFIPLLIQKGTSHFFGGKQGSLFKP